ncbi:MAG: CBS domain-containing protein [Nitrospirae bacterium]|nr:CBS domain-containing protein [Nitrospirota bacterium]
MAIQSDGSEDLKTIGELSGTDNVRFHARQNGLAIAIELLSRHISGAPVVDGKGKLIGFISEFDILKTLDSGKDLRKLRAEEIMIKPPISIDHSTTIAEAIRIMEKNHLLVLPVEKKGVVTYSVTRHDLLRARIGLGLSVEEG